MRPSLQRLVAWLCLVAFVPGQTLFAGVLVHCTEADGRQHVELTCDKADDQSCLEDCTDACDTGQHTPHPCTDKPVAADDDLLRAPDRCVSPAPVLFTVLPPLPPPPLQFAAVTREQRARPPDPLARLKGVILIV